MAASVHVKTLIFLALANAKVFFGPFLRKPQSLPGCCPLSTVLKCHWVVCAVQGGGRSKGKGDPCESLLQMRYGKQKGVYLCLAFAHTRSVQTDCDIFLATQAPSNSWRNKMYGIYWKKKKKAVKNDVHEIWTQEKWGRALINRSWGTQSRHATGLSHFGL